MTDDPTNPRRDDAEDNPDPFGCIEMLHHLLFDPPEVHATDVQQEFWEIELGERVGYRLAEYRPYDPASWLILDWSPWAYARGGWFREAIDAMGEK